MPGSRLLIRGACVVTMDDALGDLPRGDVLVGDGRIIAVGEALEADGAEIVDAAGCIAIPGFVDAHRHLWEGAMRAVTADWSILDSSATFACSRRSSSGRRTCTRRPFTARSSRSTRASPPWPITATTPAPSTMSARRSRA